MDFFDALSTKDYQKVKQYFIPLEEAIPLFPMSSRSMTLEQKEVAFIEPQQASVKQHFENLLSQIQDGDIKANKLIFHSYKLNVLPNSKKDYPINEMSMFFTYLEKEHVIPISVVQMRGQWYLLEILNSEKAFD